MKTLGDFFKNEEPAAGKEPLKKHAAMKVEDTKPEVLTETASEASYNGFVIQEVELKGFMRYIDQANIRFSEKFLAIIGKTGSGKTSILDAITFALYKRTSRIDVGLRIEDICQPSGYVKVCFKQGKDSYEVTRGLSSKNPYLILKKNDKKVLGKITELEAAIQDIIGMDYTGFRNSTFVRQDEMKQIGAESGPYRLEIFQKLFRLETFEKAKEVVDKKQTEIVIELKEIAAFVQSDSQSYEEKKQKIPVKKQEIAAIEQSIKQSSSAFSELSKKIIEAQIELKSLEKVHEEYIKNKNQLEETGRQIAILKQKLRSAISGQTAIENLKKEIANLREEIGDVDQLTAEKESLDGLQKENALLQSKLSSAKRQLDQALRNYHQQQKKLQQRLKELEARINGLTSELNKEAAFGLLRAEGRLIEKMERIPREISWVRGKKEIANQLEEELQQAKHNLALIGEKTKQINLDSFVRSEIENQIERVKLDLEELEQKWQSEKKLESEIQDTEKEIKALGFGSAEEARSSQLKVIVEKKIRQRRELDRKIEEAGKASDSAQLIGEFNQQISDFEARYEKLKKIIANLEPEEQRFEAAREELEALRDEHKKLEKAISAKEGEKTALQNSLKDLEEEIERIKARIAEREKELAVKQEMAEVYTILKENVFHRKGIVTFAINQLLPQLAIEASENLADLTDRRFTKLRLATYEESNRYGINIEVEGSDVSFRDVKEFSGGEKTQINAALRFAIAKELASMPQIGRSYARMKTLFIDEGDLGSLDTEVSRELFVKKLFDMGKFFERVILITHLTEIAERFPHRIRVYMTEDEKSRVEQIA